MDLVIVLIFCHLKRDLELNQICRSVSLFSLPKERIRYQRKKRPFSRHGLILQDENASIYSYRQMYLNRKESKQLFVRFRLEEPIQQQLTEVGSAMQPTGSQLFNTLMKLHNLVTQAWTEEIILLVTVRDRLHKFSPAEVPSCSEDKAVFTHRLHRSG